MLNVSTSLNWMLRRHSQKISAAEPVRREYLPGYHESRDGLKALVAERHHYINLARTENRFAGLAVGERKSAGEQQPGLLIVMQKKNEQLLTKQYRTA